jgi:hypothetical protein
MDAKKILAALGCAYWMQQAFGCYELFKHIPSVREMPLDGERPDWPCVSVVITACDEEEAIGDTVRHRLEDDYHSLEVILVNDRSSDRTGEIMERLASGDPRVKVIHLKELPDGWLGKVHAMDHGAAAASGEWLLFSDADVVVAPGTIARTISYAEEQGLDHLAVMPEFLPANLILDAGLTNLFRVFCLVGQVWKADRPGSNAAVGSGSYNLVRRSTLEEGPGLEYLKMEAADDVALGQMLKDSGARQRLAKGNGYVLVEFYPTIRAAISGSERSLFTSLGGCSLVRASAIGLGFTILESAPLILLAAAREKRLRKLGAALFLTQAAVSIAYGRWMERPVAHAAFAPVMSVVMGALMISAGVLGTLRGGIFWKGTFYPKAMLRQGRRFRF